MFGNAVRRLLEYSSPSYHEETRLAHRVAQTQLNVARTELEKNFQALHDAQEMFDHAGGSLERIDQLIETILAEGLAQVEAPMPVYMQYLELQLGGLIQ